jgi:hypothetical protein
MCKLSKHHEFLIKLLNIETSGESIAKATVEELKVIVEIVFNISKYFEVDEIQEFREKLLSTAPNFNQWPLKWLLGAFKKELALTVGSILYHVNTEAFELVCVNNGYL